jgi:RNA polymerase sigma-70 factor (ECF subfamily)
MVAPVSDMPESSFDVAACLQRVRQRDEDAARALFRHLYPLVARLVRSHLPRRTSPEDLVQTVFMKIFASLDSFSGTVPLEHWVSRIAINACLNQLAAEKARPELRWADLTEEQTQALEKVTAGSADSDPTQNLASREIVEKLLAQLAPTDRLVLTLLHLEGRSVDEVRQITGWNVPVIKVRAFRARRKLRKCFEQLMEEKTKNQGRDVARQR